MRSRFEWKGVARGLLALLAFALFVRVLLAQDLKLAVSLVTDAGPLALAILVPYFVAIVFDSTGWRLLLGALSHRPSLWQLIRIRVAAEALNSLPSGAVFAEPYSAAMLRQRCGLPISDAIVGAAAKKWLVTRTHALYIGVSVALGWGLLTEKSQSLMGVSGLPWVVLASALVPQGISVFMGGTLVRGTFVMALFRTLSRLPARLGAWFRQRESAFLVTQTQFQHFGNVARNASVRATPLFLLAWLTESVESFLILRVLGASPGFVAVLSFEAGLSLLRSFAFFAPMGLGVQDLGYLRCFSSFGIPHAEATATAFVLLKRGKELVWIAVGSALLFAKAKEPTPQVATG
jgi:uncharacterized protein (TIRG00374 family)